MARVGHAQVLPGSHQRVIDERRLVHGLGQVLVAAGFEPGHDVLGIRLGRDQDDGHERH